MLNAMKAEWTAAYINDLPDRSFAYVEAGGTKDAGGKTTPRSLRHFPIRDANGKPDAAHVRNALSRLPQSEFEAKARGKVEAAAKELGIGEPAQKSTFEAKAEPMSGRRLDRWLMGDIPRRVLVVPFTGPLPGGKAGLDLDGEYFDAETDLYGPFPALHLSRERMVDWHHDDFGVNDPKASRMKGTLLGRIVLDEDPEDDGYWADWWAKAGERRLALIKSLEERSVPLFGSSQAAFKQKADDGRIEVWPLIRHTITTSPQNTHAVVPSLKAYLDDPDIPFDEVGLSALRAALVGLDMAGASLQGSFTDAGSGLRPRGRSAGKAGRVLSAANEAELRRALEALGTVLSKLDRADILEELAS
jgi:hypothetical protein